MYRSRYRISRRRAEVFRIWCRIRLLIRVAAEPSTHGQVECMLAEERAEAEPEQAARADNFEQALFADSEPAAPSATD